MRGINLNFDSNVFAYSLNGDVGVVQEVYGVKSTMPLVVNILGGWSVDTGLVTSNLTKWERRIDLGGLPLTITTAEVDNLFMFVASLTEIMSFDRIHHTWMPSLKIMEPLKCGE